MSTVADTPVIQLDILVQDAQSLVDHQRCQRASQFRIYSTHFGDNGGMREVLRVEPADRSVMLCRPGLRQRWQVQEAVIEDRGCVEDTRTLRRFRDLAFGFAAEEWSRI
jgi:hypothetical protein